MNDIRYTVDKQTNRENKPGWPWKKFIALGLIGKKSKAINEDIINILKNLELRILYFCILSELINVTPQAPIRNSQSLRGKIKKDVLGEICKTKKQEIIDIKNIIIRECLKYFLKKNKSGTIK